MLHKILRDKHASEVTASVTLRNLQAHQVLRLLCRSPLWQSAALPSCTSGITLPRPHNLQLPKAPTFETTRQHLSPRPTPMTYTQPYTSISRKRLSHLVAVHSIMTSKLSICRGSNHRPPPSWLVRFSACWSGINLNRPNFR